ncbi:MAG: NUDIX domain-containing protein [Thermoproteota archaeon]|nr:NUDIX domain-containing protein [Thermoproteota archaeon]
MECETSIIETKPQGVQKKPVPAVDFIITKDENSKILIVKRKNGPFRSMLSIPGCSINEVEKAEDTMRREAR